MPAWNSLPTVGMALPIPCPLIPWPIVGVADAVVGVGIAVGVGTVVGIGAGVGTAVGVGSLGLGCTAAADVGVGTGVGVDVVAPPHALTARSARVTAMVNTNQPRIRSRTVRILRPPRRLLPIEHHAQRRNRARRSLATCSGVSPKGRMARSFPWVSRTKLDEVCSTRYPRADVDSPLA
jgi:hypothetical protein